MIDKITKNFIPAIENHPIAGCILYLLFSFIVEMFIPSSFIAMCIVDFTFYIMVLCRRTFHPIQHIKQTKNMYFLLFVTVITLIFTAYFWSRWYMSTIPDDSSLSYMQSLSNTDIYTYLLMIGVAAPLGEESLFRYVLINGFNKTFSKCSSSVKMLVSLLLSSAIFAIMHGTGVHLFVGLFCGLAFGLVYMVTNKLYLSILTHSCYNIGTLFMHIPISLSICIILTLLSICFTVYIILSFNFGEKS